MIMLGAGCGTEPIVVHEITTPDGPVIKPAPEKLLVLPLSGLSPRFGIAMGVRTAWALRQAGYPANHVTVSDGYSPVLTGWITETSSSGDILWLDIDWAAYGSDGGLIAKYEQKTAVPSQGWARLSAETMGAVVVEAMSGIDNLIRLEMFPPGSSGPQPILEMTEFAAPQTQSLETIVVSGQGIAKVDKAGKETWEPLVSVTAVIEDGQQVTEFSPAPITLIDPSARKTAPLDAYISGELTDEYSAGIDTDLPDIDNMGDLPQPDPVQPVQPVQQAQPVQPTQPQQTAALETITPEEAMELAPVVESQPAQQPAAIAAFAPSTYRPVFLVRQAFGAPGNGNLELRDALRKALRNNDAMVTQDLKQASHIVQGTVRVEVPFAGRQRVRIVWMVTNTAGLEMGTALQENDVAEGVLSKPWGIMADKIAGAAVLGIAQLFDAGLDSGGAGGELSQPDLPHLQ